MSNAGAAGAFLCGRPRLHRATWCTVLSGWSSILGFFSWDTFGGRPRLSTLLPEVVQLLLVLFYWAQIALKGTCWLCHPIEDNHCDSSCTSVGLWHCLPSFLSFLFQEMVPSEVVVLLRWHYVISDSVITLAYLDIFLDSVFFFVRIWSSGCSSRLLPIVFTVFQCTHLFKQT